MIGWETAHAGPNMTFSPDCANVDILGGGKGTVLATTSFISGVHAWEIKVRELPFKYRAEFESVETGRRHAHAVRGRC